MATITNTSSAATEAVGRVGRAAAAVGTGLLAGAVGTLAMTVSTTVEMRLRRRDASTAPADAAAKVLGVHPDGDREQARFSNVVHWTYGTMWGSVRGLLGAFGLRGVPAGVAHFAAAWGNELVMLPALEVAPPLREWGATELAIDALHHLVYAAATSVAYEYVERAAVGR